MSDWPSGIRYRPLEVWPGERTAHRTYSPFRTSRAGIMEEFRREVRAHGAKNVVLQVDIRERDLRNDGLPRADARPASPAVILSFETKAGAISFPCDTFNDWMDNLLAIVRTMEKLRAIDRYRVTKNGEQYRGWMALPATATPTSFSTVEDAVGFIRAMSGERPEADDRDGVTRAIRRAKRNTHPDIPGGSSEAFQRVTDAETYLRSVGAL